MDIFKIEENSDEVKIEKAFSDYSIKTNAKVFMININNHKVAIEDSTMYYVILNDKTSILEGYEYNIHTFSLIIEYNNKLYTFSFGIDGEP